MREINLNYEAMSREELIAEMKRLRHMESDIRAEATRMTEDALQPIRCKLHIIQGHLGLHSLEQRPHLKPHDVPSSVKLL